MTKDEREYYLQRVAELQRALTAARNTLHYPDSHFVWEYAFEQVARGFEVRVLSPEYEFTFTQRRRDDLETFENQIRRLTLSPNDYERICRSLKGRVRQFVPKTGGQEFLRVEDTLKREEVRARDTLEYYGKLWGVERNEGETDDQYRERILNIIRETGRLPDMTFKVEDPDTQC